MAPQPKAVSPADLNAANLQARAAVVGLSRRQEVVIYNGGVDVANSRDLLIPIRNVGLVTNVQVNVELSVQSQVANGGASLSRTIWGAYNAIKRLNLRDFSSNVRIDASGKVLTSILSQRSGKAAASAEALSSYPASYGQTNGFIAAAPTIDAGATEKVYMTYNVPVSYSKTDLTGAMYANVSNANAYLTITLPTDAEISSTGNAGDGQAAFNSVYFGGAAKILAAKVIAVQCHYDQLPRGQGGSLIVPQLDLQSTYEIKESRYTEGLAAGGEVRIPFANNRRFLSAACFYNNGAAMSYDGEDIATITLEQANTYRWFERDPRWFAYESRQRIGLDSPIGLYHFETRDTPLSTEAAGNIELAFRLAAGINVDPAAHFLIGFEALGPAPVYGTDTTSL